jgi:hypothetical protein
MRAKMVNENLDESLLGGILIGVLSGYLLLKFIHFIFKRIADKSDRKLLTVLINTIENLITSRKDEFGITDLNDRYYISIPNTISNIKDIRIFKNTKVIEIMDQKIQMTEKEYNIFLSLLNRISK